MTTYDQKIQDAAGNDPAFGDHVTVSRTISGLTTSQTISKAWLTIKRGYGDADADAKLQLEITASSTAAGQITDDGTDATEGTIEFTISGTDYDDLLRGKTHVYDIQTLLGDGTIATLEVGQVTWRREVTRAES